VDVDVVLVVVLTVLDVAPGAVVLVGAPGAVVVVVASGFSNTATSRGWSSAGSSGTSEVAAIGVVPSKRRSASYM
jgi:hypothetical protein